MKNDYTIFLVVVFVAWAIISGLKSAPLPTDCHVTLSVDVGGTGVDCD